MFKSVNFYNSLIQNFLSLCYKLSMRKLNVLLADDIEGWLVFNRQNLKEILRNFDISFYSFKSAREAYEFAFSFNQKIDLVVTDLEMEPMEKTAGEWLIENLKMLKSTENAKYLIISSSYNIEHIAIRTESNGYIRKPSYNLNPTILKYKLEEILGEI